MVRRDYNIESIFIGLRHAWHPPSAAIEASFTSMTRTLAGIYKTLGSDPDLAPLHAEIYRDFPGLPTAPPPEPADRRKISDRRAVGADTTVKSFYLCNSLIQLMEDVYLDLRLEREHRHPDNRGWMNLFGHWASSDTFRKAWALSAPTYGLRFQAFCRRRLGLTLGTTDLESLWDARYSKERPLNSKLAGEALNDAERHVIEVLTNSHLRGERNPVAERARQVVICRLRVPQGPEAELGIDHGTSPHELVVTYGIAVISGDTRYDPTADQEEDSERDDAGRLLTLRVRQHLRDQGLGRQLMEDLIRRMGVCRTALPNPAEMGALGLAAEVGDRIDSIFKSVVNEVLLHEQRPTTLRGNPAFFPLPRLSFSGVVRPRDATWAHAVGFIYWILAWSDGVTDAEKEAVREALRIWAGEHVKAEEVAFAAEESRQWYLTAKRPVTALWPEVRALVRALKSQSWFDDDRRRQFRDGLETIALADTKRRLEGAEPGAEEERRSKEESDLIEAIRKELLPEQEKPKQQAPWRKRSSHGRRRKDEPQDRGE